MKQPKTFLLLSVILSILVLGVAYAAITNVTFNVSGNVVATGDQANFKVKFINAEVNTKVGNASGTANIEASEKDAIIELNGFTKANDEVEVIFTIENKSDDLYAIIKIKEARLTGVNKGEFNMQYQIYPTNIAPGETSRLIINIKLLRTPINDITATAKISFVAEPSNEPSLTGNSIGGNTIGEDINDGNNTIYDNTINENIVNGNTTYDDNTIGDDYNTTYDNTIGDNIIDNNDNTIYDNTIDGNTYY